MNDNLEPLARHGFAILLGLFCSVFSAGAAAQVLSPQDKLAAIRHELVQAALDAPTDVQVTQWIDAQGVLRESSSFRSGMKIRGVRVLSYVQDPQGEPGAKVEWQTPAPHHAAEALAPVRPGQHSKNCKRAEPGHLHHIAALAWIIGAQWSADDFPLLLDFKALFRSDWERRSANTATWRLAEPRAEVQRSSYNQALLASGADDIPWKINLSVEQVPSPKLRAQLETDPKFVWNGGNPPHVPNPPLQLQLRMTLSNRLQSRPVLQLTAPLDLQAQPNNWEAARLNLVSRQRVLQQAQSWAEEIEGVLACLPVVAQVIQVTQATKSEFRINSGAAAGVRIGDEWLLADDQKIPQRLLEADTASRTVLGKVQFVDQYHALIQVQAGSTSMVQRNWNAWAVENSN
jgi:hypothetical protein